MNDEVKNIIVREFGLGAASPEMQDEMIAEIGGLIFQGALMRGMERVDEKDLDKFEQMFAQNKEPNEVFAFLNEHIQGFEELVAEEARNFKARADKTMSQIG